LVIVTCPHCGTEFEEECEDIQDSEQYEAECPDCEKVFGYSITVIISADSFELSCGGKEGDGPHDWKPRIGWPEEYFRNKFYCTICGLEKNETAKSV
jgi:uncharacterized Zn-finger protein